MPLFNDVVDWKLIEAHCRDLFRVVLSIKVGKILPSKLLRKLSSISKENTLYQVSEKWVDSFEQYILLDISKI